MYCVLGFEVTMFSNGRYNIPGMPRFIEYEVEDDIYEFFKRGIDSYRAEMKAALTRKCRRDFIAIGKQKFELAKVKKWMLENPACVLSVQDSIATGNCKYGTKTFMERYNISENSTCLQLLKNANFDAMLRDFYFCKVIASKME